MRTYEKIPAVYKRDTNGSKKLIEGQFANSYLGFLANNEWQFTEKIDGTNIRIHWDGHKVEFGGRTDRASIPAPLLEYLHRTFGGDVNEELFEQKFGESDVILYGEGYGPKIQKGGGLYRNDVSFILFDVYIGGMYLERENVEDIAKTFGIDVVPIVCEGTLADGVEFVKTKPKSTIGAANMEGIVGRPIFEMQDRRGDRIIVKIKVRDFE